MSKRVLSLSAVVASMAAIGMFAALPAYADPNNNTVKKLTKAVTAEGVLDHLEAFQEIADENGGNRASGLPGYKASVDYVVERLEDAGYQPEVQEFTFDYFEENSELIRRAPEPEDLRQRGRLPAQRVRLGYAEGTATGPLYPVGLVLDPSLPNNSNTSGCEALGLRGDARRRRWRSCSAAHAAST